MRSARQRLPSSPAFPGRDAGWIAAGLLLGALLSFLGMRHLFDLGNLGALDLAANSVAATIGVRGGALLGASFPLLRALGTNPALLLQAQT